MAEAQNATCTITNTAIPPKLTLIKTVDNGSTGATAVATDWTLTGTGPVTIAGATGSPAVTQAIVQVGSYTLTENGPAGYTAGAWSCTGATPTGNVVPVPLGGNVRCTINNTAQQSTLTLVKVVDNGTTGATATAADWTLSAAGPTPFSGTANTPAVTSIPVEVGAYALTESGGPAGYTASGWTCTGAPVAAGTATIALGAHATCTITNTAVAPRLTLIKTVTDDNGAGAVPTDWLLSATGPTDIEGTTGAATVTNAQVQVGDYVLAESGPTGFTASEWSCTRRDRDGAGVRLHHPGCG